MLFCTGVPVNKNRLLVWIRRSMAISWHLGFFNRWPSSTTNNGHCSRLKKALSKGDKRRSEHGDESITFHWWWCDRQWSARWLRVCSSVDFDSFDYEVQRVSPWDHDRRYRWSKRNVSRSTKRWRNSNYIRCESSEFCTPIGQGREGSNDQKWARRSILHQTADECNHLNSLPEPHLIG